MWQDTFYETSNEIATRFAELVPKGEPQEVADLATEARDRLQLRHVPLFVLRELARRKGTGPVVEKALGHVIQRADELAEFLAMYWNEKRQPLAAGVSVDSRPLSASSMISGSPNTIVQARSSFATCCS